MDLEFGIVKKRVVNVRENGLMGNVKDGYQVLNL
jgi:hypothetical protein